MTGTTSRMSWTARLSIALVLLLGGAAAATWGLAHSQRAARFLGVVQAPAPQAMLTPKPVVVDPAAAPAAQVAADPRIAALESRIERVENSTQRAEGFAGRADALVVAFAARRAIDRGVALGYLEPLLVDRFGAQHQAAVATIVTASRNPVRLEPGRYTTILEPQAVGDLVASLFSPQVMDRQWSEKGDPQGLNDSPYIRPESDSPFNAKQGYSKLGQKVIDERLTVATDPMDPDLGFPPFKEWQVYHPVTWIQDGVLKELPYSRSYAVKKLSLDTGGIPLFGTTWTGAFHMSVRGETATVEEMIATTKRGVLVTRFSGIGLPIDLKSLLLSGYTRDGTWLVENGKISHPIKNFRFTESPFFALNSIEQIGMPQRIFHPGIPIVVPPLKVRDFSFTSLSDAV